MSKSGSRFLRRLSLCAAVVVSATACASDGEWGSQPADATRMGNAIAPGSSASGNYLAALHAQAQHQGGTAANHYTSALAKDADNTELLQRAFMLMAAEGRLDEATELAKRLVNYDPDASLATILLAVRAAKAGDFAAGEQRAAALPRRGINAYISPLLMAWMQVGQGKTDKALAQLSPLADNSHLVTLHDFHSGLILDLAGRDQGAEEYYRSTVSTPAGMTIRAVQAVGGFYQRQGRNDDARQLYAAFARLHPESALFDTEAALATDTAAPRLIGSAKAGLAESLFAAATTVRQGNATHAAKAFARLALDLQPDFPLAQLLLADTLQAEGRLADANAVYGGIAADAAVWPSVQMRMAANQDTLGDTEAAILRLRKLSQKQPESPDPLVAAGELLRKHERYGEAVQAYDTAVARIDADDIRYWPVYYSRGISLERSGQWQRAENDLLKALELEPDQPHVLNYLGYSWVEKGINLPQARRMIEKAVELRPNDGYIVDSLGWVLFQLGEHDDAVVQLERAAELRPGDATINDHLGDALAKVGRIEEARYHWQRALSVATEDKLIDSIREKLATTPVPGTTAAANAAGTLR